MTKIVFPCCYCGEILEDDSEDNTGVSLYDMETGEMKQCWFAHESCARKAMLPLYGEEIPEINWKEEP